MAEGQDYENMSDAEMKQQFEKGMEMLSRSKGMEAMTRFFEATRKFADANPDHAELLGDAIEEGMPQQDEEDYY